MFLPENAVLPTYPAQHLEESDAVPEIFPTTCLVKKYLNNIRSATCFRSM